MTEVVNVLGVPVAAVSIHQLHQYIKKYIEEREKALVLNVNVFALNLAYEQPWLRQLFQRAHIVFCDGAGVILGARLLGQKIPARITYADWTWQLAELAAQQGFRLYFLGGRPGVAEKAAQKLRLRFPALCIIGTHDGYFDKTQGCEENEAVIAQINSLQPDILLVGFGMPLQEKWLSENWERIDACVVLTGGAVFDYISGDLRRAPRWMTDHGLEWLGRLVIEPRRLWKRYLIGNPLFFWRVLLQSVGIKKMHINE